MLIRLIKIRLQAYWDSIIRASRKSGSDKKNSSIRKILMSVFAIYVIFSLSFSIGGMFSQMARQMIAVDLDWLYFSYISITVLFFNFLGSVFTITSQIHEAKDNDLLLAMPILPRHILSSRIASVLIINYIYTLVFALPAYVVYVFLAGFKPLNLIAFALSTLVLPFLAISLSSFIGWLISLVTYRLKRKGLITAFFQLVFFALYMFFMTNINKYMQKLVENGEEIGEAIRKAFPPAYSYGMAVGNTDIKHMLILLALCVIPFIIAYVFMLKTFVKMATTKKSAPDVVYIAKERKPLSVSLALLKKEFSRFFTLPAYIMNSALGVFIEIFFAIYIMFNADKVALTFSNAFPFEIENILPFSIGILLAAQSLMSFTTASSLSLEGRNLQLLKSLPVRAKDIFDAKIRMNIILGTPSIIIVGFAVSIGFKLPILQAILIFLLPFAAQSFIAVFGMFINILFPRFDWRNEIYAIKQGMSVVITMFAGIAILLFPSVIGFFLLEFFGIELALGFITLFLAILSLILYKYISSKGQHKLNHMDN